MAQLGQSEKQQVVTFRLGSETYGIGIFEVQEVIVPDRITVVPNAPRFIEGVISLRDRVIPVVDLGKRLGVAGVGGENAAGAHRRIMVLDFDERELGVIVDELSRVLLVGPDDLEQLPAAMVREGEQTAVKALAKTEEGLVIMLAPERILDPAERRELQDMGSGAMEAGGDDESPQATT